MFAVVGCNSDVISEDSGYQLSRTELPEGGAILGKRIPTGEFRQLAVLVLNMIVME